MAGSTAEREIRDAISCHFRLLQPEARVVHELAVGGCRADLGIIDVEHVTLVEIKSAKDTLTRLKRQCRVFVEAAHRTVAVIDEKWWKHGQGALREHTGYQVELWHWPCPSAIPQYNRQWRARRPSIAQPAPRRMLEILWKQELLDEAAAHGIAVKTRWTCREIIDAMAYYMTGQQLAKAACRQLRHRSFVEADPAIVE